MLKPIFPLQFHQIIYKSLSKSLNVIPVKKFRTNYAKNEICEIFVELSLIVIKCNQ